MADLTTLAAPDLDARTLHGILRLRCEVFVVEQQCPYQDVDSWDVEPSTVHVLALSSSRPVRGQVIACLRVLTEPDGGVRIGRLCTAASQRGRGLAAALMQRAIEVVARRTAVLDAQTNLVRFYQRFGFAACGADFLEDGIPHTPMRRDG